MLFDYGPQVIESEKERNLYFKFFAGYYFNELIPGYKQRVERFYKLVNENGEEYINYPHKREMLISPKDIHITFDLHAYLLNPNADKGELADVLIYDQTNKTVICIEAKFLSDWNVKKDICSNSKRIKKVAAISSNKQLIFVQILLITKAKWQNVCKRKKQNNSSYRALHEIKDVPLIILTWDKLIDICRNDEGVRKYFKHHILRTKADFRMTYKI